MEKSKSKSSCAMLKCKNKERQFVHVKCHQENPEHWLAVGGGSISLPEWKAQTPMHGKGGVRIYQKEVCKKFKIG